MIIEMLRPVVAGSALLLAAACSETLAPSVPSTVPATTEAQLSAVERADLLWMREEEKLARDVYAAHVAEGNVFANIARSEQTHMDAVLQLLETYALADPAVGRGAGQFVDAELQQLYDMLAARAERSTEEALRVAAEIEELDLLDLDDAIARTTHDDIARVYDSLARGSRNHLRATVSNLARRGVTYAPLHLTQADFDAILASATERGP
jgi:hypothetical protein